SRGRRSRSGRLPPPHDRCITRELGRALAGGVDPDGMAAFNGVLGDHLLRLGYRTGDRIAVGES
ncbi:MAG TPA: hypothetical protein VEG38_06700, partial [Acidimicrobiia bacterium]|nr:hypothetical protein [Acidimicrobiia bacterium]